jgi:hypothetical protein
MTPMCAGCGAALSQPQPRKCAVCGLKVGDLPSNVQQLRAIERQRRATARAGWSARPIVLVLVLGLMLAMAFGAGAEAGSPGQPVLGAIGRGALTVAEAAESAIGRRSRTPGPGNPESEQWKQSGPAQVAVLVVLAGGLILFLRTRR